MHCEHVVLFDFPRDPSEYVRRVGRTARGAGGRGVVSTLVLGRQVRGWPVVLDIVQCRGAACLAHSRHTTSTFCIVLWHLASCPARVVQPVSCPVSSDPAATNCGHHPLPFAMQVALAQEIIGRNQKGQPVHRIPEL
jgi:hypothetical protein